MRISMILAALLVVGVAGSGSEEGRNALFDDGGASARDTLPFNDYSFGDDGDDDADTMGAVYHMSQADFQRRHSDFKQDAQTASQAKAAHDFEAKVRAKPTAIKPSALAQGMAKENKKLHKLNLDEATEVAAVQAQRENAASIQAKQDSNRPDLMDASPVLRQNKAAHHMLSPVSWHAGGQDSANQGMVATYHPEYKRQEKKDAAALAQQAKKGKNLLREQAAPVETNPWDPTSMIQLSEEEKGHAKETLAASNAAFEQRLERLEHLATPKQKKLPHKRAEVLPLEDNMTPNQKQLDASNAKLKKQIERMEDLAKH